MTSFAEGPLQYPSNTTVALQSHLGTKSPQTHTRVISWLIVGKKKISSNVFNGICLVEINIYTFFIPDPPEDRILMSNISTVRILQSYCFPSPGLISEVNRVLVYKPVTDLLMNVAH